MRFLVLPGYLQSGKILAEKSSGLRKLLTKKGYQLDYIDPPIIINHYNELSFTLADTKDACDAKWQDIVNRGLNKCWWQHSDENGYQGFDQALNYVVDYIKQKGPYDGIIGFSQGSAMAIILINTITKYQIESFKVGMLFSGFCFTNPKDPKRDRININYQIEDQKEYIDANEINSDYGEYYNGSHQVPTRIINVYGSEDMVVPSVRSKFINSIYDGVVNIEHDGGHMMPNKKVFTTAVLEALEGRE